MLLVTGATGHIGRELVRELAERGAGVRSLVRDPARAAGEHVVGDLGEPASLTPAFDGVDKLFLLVPGTGLDHTANALAAARTAGVKHVVLLSSFQAVGDPVPPMGRWHRDREELVQASGIPATILRPGGFMTNALDWLATINSDGFVFDPFGEGRYAPIDPADIAAVAAVALTEDGHQGKEYTLTGEETFTIAEQVRVLATATGREIAVRAATTPEEAVRFRFPNGAPPALAEAITAWFRSMRADTVGYRTDTVRAVLGRAPRTFADWCAHNAHLFR